MLAALLLSLAEARREDIIADYEISYTLLPHPGPEIWPSLPENIIGYLDKLEEYGGARCLLLERCALDPALLDAVFQRLTVG